MTLHPPWHLLDSAIERYLHARQWPESDRARAARDLETLVLHARLKATDAEGRELWRSPPSRQLGANLRWVVLPPRQAGDRPFVPWVGFGRPPSELFTAEEPAALVLKECPHLPTLGEVYELTLAPVATPAQQRRVSAEVWRARVCARCAEAVRAAALSRGRLA